MSLACAAMLPETGCCLHVPQITPLIPVLHSNSCHLLRILLLRAGSWPKIGKHGPEPQLGLLKAALRHLERTWRVGGEVARRRSEAGGLTLVC